MVRNCYIERLVYDNIYTNTFYRQDLGHLVELKSMEQMHDSYYKNESIGIKIRYRDEVYPESLHLHSLSRNMGHLIFQSV